MRIGPSSYFLLFLLILGAMFVVLSMGYPTLESKLIGITVGLAVVIIGVIQLLRETLVKEKVEGQEAEEQRPQGVEAGILLRRSGILAAWIGGFSITIYLLGFLVAIPLFVISYLKLHDTKWLAAICIAALATAISYGLIQVLLELELWRGLISFL
jgi:hypothetical protein